MSELITQTARLVPYLKRPKQVPSYVTAYAYEPMADEPGAALGNMYVVMEVLISGRASVEVADIIIETLGEHYYNHPEAAHAPLERFEAAIKAVNHGLSELVNRGNAAWIGKLSAVLAIQIGEELHVAQTGSAEAYLYRGKAGTRINAGTPSRPTTPNKTFGALATGQLEAGDRFLLATPALIHQVPLSRLQSIISQSVPSTAIAEITELLKGVSVDRIGAIIVEITTPELAALQLRSEKPSEIQLGVPENAIEAAKFAAAPIATSTVSSTKKVAGVARTAWHTAQPTARNISLQSAAKVRALLSSKKGRVIVLSCLAALVILLIVVTISNHIATQNDQYFASYQSAYSRVSASDSAFAKGDSKTASDNLNQATSTLSSLKAHAALINSRLKSATLPEGEPRTFDQLEVLIKQRQAKLEGLVQATSRGVTTFGSAYGNTDRFEIYNGRAYVFGSGSHVSLTIVNLTTGSIAASGASVASIGAITDTALSYDHSGIYIGTSAPSVWFYRFATDSLTHLSNMSGKWSPMSAIASYGSNLYLLDGNTVYKYSKLGASFAKPTASTTLPTQATALAVDGSIYAIDGAKLDQFVAGSLAHSVTTSPLASDIETLRSFQNGSFLIGVSANTSHIVEWSVGSGGPTIKQVISLSGDKLSDAAYDPATKTIYALSNNQLVALNTQP